MTECERLIKEGKLKLEFLLPECREGYMVDKRMKKVWAILIDLYQKFKEICDKYNLRYFAIGGTAIGAVRHKGFIPWDDDLDLAMPRKDYDIFVSVAPKEFEHPYFFQSPQTDPNFFNRYFVRLRNSETTGIGSFDKHVGCNNGIFIDIFPLDIYNDTIRCKWLVKKSYLQAMVAWNKKHYAYLKQKNFSRKMMYYLSPVIMMGNTQQLYKRHEKKCRKIKPKSKHKIGIMYEIFLGDYKRWLWPAECAESVEEVPFEYTTIQISSKCDEMLKISFGDYMKYPPVDKRVQSHSIEFEPDVSYKKYININS